MRRSHQQGTLTSNHIALHTVQVEELLRFTRSMDALADPEQLLGALPTALSRLVPSNTIALVYVRGASASCYAVDGNGAAIGGASTAAS